MTTVSDIPLSEQATAGGQIDAYSTARLEDMEQAAKTVQVSLRKLEDQSTSVVGEILKGQGDFVPWDHYPAGDVYDWDSQSQYYYHTHPADHSVPGFPSTFWEREHGHFHTFLRAKACPPARFPPTCPARILSKTPIPHFAISSPFP